MNADLRLLLATTFSSACEDAAAAVARLAASCRVDLTVAHVVPPGARTQEVHSRLEAALGGSDLLQGGRRILLESDDPAAAVAQVAARERVDAIVAPASSRWYPFIAKSSFRRRLLEQSRVPLWTAGRRGRGGFGGAPVRTVACVVDLVGSDGRWLRAADAFARRIDARLFLLATIPPVDDGLLTHVLTAHAPLTTAAAVARARSLARDCVVTGIDVAVGGGVATVNRQIHRCGADLVFASRDWALRDIDRLSCPAVCVDAASLGQGPWSFQQVAGRSAPRFTLGAGAAASA